MKKITLLLFALIGLSAYAAKIGGSVTADPDPIVPNSPVTITHDGTDLEATDKCFMHAWLSAKDGQTFTGSYSTSWATVTTEAEYNALPENQKLTKVGTGYEITINSLEDFFSVQAEDVDKIGSMGLIIRRIGAGDENQSIDFTLAVGAPLVAADRFNFNFGSGASWSDYNFTESATDPNLFNVTVTIPDPYDTYEYWIGWNKGGTGSPAWVGTESGGYSNTESLSLITDIKSGEVTIQINKTSTDNNWGPKVVELGSGITGVWTDIELSATNGTVYCSAENFKIYNTLGVDVTSKNGQLSGVVIVKVGDAARSIYVTK